ncbi:hypothetical protein JCM17823_28620 [Halorubrum gandharaense]
MPDENRFSGIGSAMDAEDSDEGAANEAAAERSSSATESPPADDADRNSKNDDEQSAGGPADGEAASSTPLDTPAFAFEQTGAKSLYLRSSTVDVLDDTEFEVEAVLRREHDVRNLTGREFHDAAVRVLADHADEIAERVVDAREE